MRKTPRMECHIVKLLTADCACFPVGLLIGVQSILFICYYRSSCLTFIGDEQCQFDTMLRALTSREKQFSFPLLKLHVETIGASSPHRLSARQIKRD